MTAQQLIYLALRRVGQFPPGFTGMPELQADMLLEWQLTYDRMNAVRTNAYTTPDYILPIGSSTGLNGIYGQNVQFSIGPTFTVVLGITSGSATATCANTQGLVIGMYPVGTGIPANTYITSILDSTSITLSALATANNAALSASITATFNVRRPEKIVKMNLFMTSTTPTQPTRIPMAQLSVEEWASISVVQISPPINVALSFYYQAQYPQGIINIWPPINGNSLELFTWGYLVPPATLATEMLLPPGYQELTVCGLAMKAWRLVTNNQRINDLSYAQLVAQFEKVQQEIQSVNQSMNRVRNDFGGGRYYPQAGGADWAGLMSGYVS